MSKITKEKYEFALARIEELLPMVDDNTPAHAPIGSTAMAHIASLISFLFIVVLFLSY